MARTSKQTSCDYDKATQETENNWLSIHITRDERYGTFDFTLFDMQSKIFVSSTIDRAKIIKENLQRINDTFLKWCEDNDYTPVIKKLTPWARDVLDEENYVYLENTSKEYLFKVILKRYDIEDDDNILDTLQSLGLLDKDNVGPSSSITIGNSK